MATITTSFTPEGLTFPYIGIGVDPAQFITMIPSAEVMFQITSGAVTLSGVGDDQKINIDCALPRSFAWALVESSLILKSVDAGDWDLNCRSWLVDATTNPVYNTPIEYVSEGLAHDTTLQESLTYTVRNLPTKIIVPHSTLDANFHVQLHNITLNDAAGVMTFSARFLRYDLNQAHYFAVNTPLLTR